MSFTILNYPSLPEPDLKDPRVFVRALHEGINAQLNEMHEDVMELSQDDDHPPEFYKGIIKDYRPGLSFRDITIISTALNVYETLVSKRDEQRRK